MNKRLSVALLIALSIPSVFWVSTRLFDSSDHSKRVPALEEDDSGSASLEESRGDNPDTSVEFDLEKAPGIDGDILVESRIPMIGGFREILINSRNVAGRYIRTDSVFRYKESGQAPVLESRSTSIANQYLLRLSDPSRIGELESLAESHGYGVEAIASSGSLCLVSTDRADDLLRFRPFLENLAESNDWIEYGEPDYLVRASAFIPNDPDFSLQSNLQRDSIGGLNQDIDAPQAWDIERNASSIVIAVVDSGIRATHEDLRDNLWRNPSEFPNGVDDDGNGIIDDLHGFNAIADNGNIDDDDGHGTHVAGILGAKGNNGLGIAGVAWDVQLMSLKFLDETGEGSTSDAIQCVDYAIEKGADIINNSWGGSERSQSLERALRRRDIDRDGCG